MIVSFRHPDSIREYSRITERIASSGTTLKIKNSEGLSANDYIILGTIGNEKTEIKKISSVDSDTQLTISATDFAHNVDDPISYTPYNQIEYYSSSSKVNANSDDSSLTTQGSKQDLEVDDLVNEANLSAVSSGYVYARFYNSTSTSFSSYSPAVAVSGFAEDSLRHIIDMARLRTKERTEKLITDDDLLKIAKECSDIIETQRKKWGFTQETAYKDLTAAVQSYYKPSSLAGADSIERVFLGYDNADLEYVDNKDFWYKMRSMPKTILRSDATAGTAFLKVKDTTAFGTSGTLAIENETGIAYTGKTYRKFTGISGLSSAHTSNAEIFENGDLDQPTYYSWWNDHILIYPPADQFYNMHIDYYKTIPRMTDVTEETRVPMPSMFIHYLMSEILRMKSKTSKADFYMKRFESSLDLLSRKNRTKQSIRMKPAKSYIKNAAAWDKAVQKEREHGD